MSSPEECSRFSSQSHLTYKRSVYIRFPDHVPYKSSQMPHTQRPAQLNLAAPQEQGIMTARCGSTALYRYQVV